MNRFGSRAGRLPSRPLGRKVHTSRCLSRLLAVRPGTSHFWSQGRLPVHGHAAARVRVLFASADPFHDPTRERRPRVTEGLTTGSTTGADSDTASRSPPARHRAVCSSTSSCEGYEETVGQAAGCCECRGRRRAPVDSSEDPSCQGVPACIRVSRCCASSTAQQHCNHSCT